MGLTWSTVLELLISKNHNRCFRESQWRNPLHWHLEKQEYTYSRCAFAVVKIVCLLQQNSSQVWPVYAWKGVTLIVMMLLWQWWAAEIHRRSDVQKGRVSRKIDSHAREEGRQMKRKASVVLLDLNSKCKEIILKALKNEGVMTIKSENYIWRANMPYWRWKMLDTP